MTLFSVRGAAVRVNPFFLVCAALWVAAGQWNVLFAVMCALFFHESAHALTARLLGHAVESVTLYPFGGTMVIPSLEENAAHTFLIAASGPLANLLTAFLWSGGESVGLLPAWNAFTGESFTIAAFNLLPLCPLDGGRVVSSVAQAAFGSSRGGKAVSRGSIVLSSAFFLYSLVCLVRRGDSPTLAASLFLVVSAWTESRRPHLPHKREKIWKYADRVCWRKVYVDEPLLALSRTFGGASFYMLIVADRDETVRAVKTEKDVLNVLFADPSARADALLNKTNTAFIP